MLSLEAGRGVSSSHAGPPQGHPLFRMLSSRSGLTIYANLVRWAAGPVGRGS